MSSLGGPNIVTDGLVLYLDAANKKSLADVPATNLNTYSEDFSNANWGKTGTAITPNTIDSPNGTQTADTITADGQSIFRYVNSLAPSVSGVTYTISVFVKKGTNNFFQADAHKISGF